MPKTPIELSSWRRNVAGRNPLTPNYSMLQPTAKNEPEMNAYRWREVSEYSSRSPRTAPLPVKQQANMFPIEDQPLNTAPQFFRDKRVLVISPQPWDSIHLSKHHYTKEIALYAATVFFLEPPVQHGVVIRTIPVPGNERISVVRCREAVPRWVRFKAYWLYRLLMKRHVQRLRAQLGELDVVWCFDTNLYPQPGLFGGKKTLYHVVDPVPYQRQVRIGRQVYAVVSVSPSILKRFQNTTPHHRQLVVNHGLSEVFLKRNAEKASGVDVTTPQNESSTVQNTVIRFGYCGNLTRPQIDHAALLQIIGERAEFEFHFWGPYANAPSGSPQEDFVRRLRASNNVVLHGRVSTETLAAEFREMSGFLLAYRADNMETDNSNSHKILEYMSTGKVIVSKPIEYYRGAPLLEMAADDSAESYVKKFNDVTEQLNHCNRVQLFEERRSFAASQTYASQLNRIASFVSNVTEETR
jgi:glycosyltransferase involved in cell wall biosynthesis